MIANRIWLVLCMCLLTAVVTFGTVSAGFYASTQWSEAVVIMDVRAAATIEGRGHERWLEVHYHVNFQRECPSQTQHILYHDVDVLGRTRRVVMPLTLTINGLGEPHSLVDFDIPFKLPDSIQPGDWYYTARTSNSCEWLPGLVRQQIQETSPIKVYIPPVK